MFNLQVPQNQASITYDSHLVDYARKLAHCATLKRLYAAIFWSELNSFSNGD